MSEKKKAHLLWSPGFAKTLVSSMVTLGFCCYVGYSSPSVSTVFMDVEEGFRMLLLHQAHRFALWGVLSLLSSSCCLIQLVLNAFSIGCAGMNTWMGPMRPRLLALTLVLCIASWWIAIRSPVFLWKQCVLSTIFSLGNSFLPEFLYIYNNNIRGVKMPEGDENTSTFVTIKLSNLGCAACMTAVTGVALSHAPFMKRVVSVSVEDSKAIFEVRNDETTRSAALAKLIDDLDAKGFPAHVVEETSLCPGISSKAGTCAKIFRLDHMSRWCDIVSCISALLASSCCVIQLGLNVLSTLDVVHLGCAGFNTILGPLRPYTRTLMFVWLGILWYRTIRKSPSLAPGFGLLVVRTCITLLLAFLPEILLLSGGPALAPPTKDTRMVSFTIDGMGCEACLAHVNSILATSSGVVSGRVENLKSGAANLLVAKDWKFDVEDISSRLSIAGFELIQGGK